MSRPVPFLLLALACLALPVEGASAKSAGEYWQDTKDYVVAPLHWDADDWSVAGGVVLGIAASHLLDDSVRDHFARRDPTASKATGTRDFLPLAAMLAGTFTVGVLGDNKQLVDTGFDMGEALVLSTLSTQTLKVLFGRQRPFQTTSTDRFGHGGSSFPSGHTSAAFSVAQVLADELPREQWGWRWVAYGLAGATAYARLDSNVHWLSDTVAGAALGIATGRFVANRRQGGASRIAVSFAPTTRGALLSFAIHTD